MLPRVQTAVDVKKAIDRSSSLDKIGFDALVLKAGCCATSALFEDL